MAVSKASKGFRALSHRTYNCNSSKIYNTLQIASYYNWLPLRILLTVPRTKTKSILVKIICCVHKMLITASRWFSSLNDTPPFQSGDLPSDMRNKSKQFLHPVVSLKSWANYIYFGKGGNLGRAKDTNKLHFFLLRNLLLRSGVLFSTIHFRISASQMKFTRRDTRIMIISL